MIRSRSARFAALALTLTAPLVAGYAAPALASGESTTANLTAPASGSATTFTWNYSFSGSHGLSHIAIGFCSTAILEDVQSATAGSVSGEIFLNKDIPGAHDGFGRGIKFDTGQPSGTITVTFKSAHPISNSGLRIQSHSGDGQTPDAIKTTKGPGSCPGDESTTTTTTSSTTTSSTTTTTTISTTVTTGSSTTTTTAGNGTTTTTAPNGSTTTTTTGGETVGGGTTTTTTAIQTTVLAETLEKAADPAASVGPGSLARTGAGYVMFLLTLAAGLIAAGIALLSVFRRRRADSASASSPC